MSRVTPVQGEVGRYLVTSASNPNQSHMTDIIENECGCISWTTRQRRYKERTGKPFLCSHLHLARFYALQALIDVMAESRKLP